MFRLLDPFTGKFVELYELECIIAQAIDGERTTDDLTRFACTYNPAITRRQIDALVRQLLHLGALQDEPTAPGLGKVIALPVANNPADEFSAFRNELALEQQPGEPLGWTDHPMGLRRPPLVHPAGRVPDQQLGLGSHHMGAMPETFGDTVLSPVGADLFDDDDDDHVQQGAAPAAPEAEAEAEAEPSAPSPATPETVEAEQASMWQDAQATKVRWYQRRWLVVLLALSVLTGASAIIPYPLYVTSECTIVPSARAYVRSPLSGVISEILVDEGTAVRKGDVIARLDDRHLVTDRRKAIAEAERLEAELLRLRRGARPEEISQ
ncbi:MAG: biotin/lipoyl-binding protein, partial [Myxococcales bacterium]|nr:biotin/lipoyl-binding protein [Myxococcales bacterium]